MSDEKYIECEFTREIVCPYCGYEFSDSWEIGDGEDIGNIECRDCDAEFDCRRDIEVTYCSYIKVKEPK